MEILIYTRIRRKDVTIYREDVIMRRKATEFFRKQDPVSKTFIIALLLLTLSPLLTRAESGPKISYVLDARQPHTHLFQICLTVQKVKTPYIEFAMPAWIPGYNRTRDFARNVQDVEATDGQGHKLEMEKRDYQTWRVMTGQDSTIKLTYRVFANSLHDINIASHIDETHAFFNGAAVFMYVIGAENEKVTLKIEKPEAWKIATGLEQTSRDYTFKAESYDHLIDCPTEIGNFTQYDFIVGDKDHHLVFYGLENFDASFMIGDFKSIVRTCEQLFRGLPYNHYTFIFHLTSRERRSGVEHGN